MIKNFLIINCTNKNNSIGLRVNNNFFIKKFQTNIKNYDTLTGSILEFLNKYGIEVNEKFSVIVNMGPGSFSSIRVAIAVAKGIKISKKASLYGYKNQDLSEFNLNSIEFLIKKNLLENKLIKPVYMI
jgi:tRNA A37 threonylcarbamoyladenosine modification protein TsaB